MDAIEQTTTTDTLKAEREFLVHALLEVSERERRRLGQQLHDHLCQLLLGAAFAAKAATYHLPPSSPAAGELEDLVQLINSAAKQTRDLARSLNTVELDSAGLVEALRQIAADSRSGIACHLECPRPISLPASPANLHLYRIAQEAIDNAERHSRGSEIVMRFVEENGAVRLQISDNGRGFDRVQQERTGLGLALMKYHAEAINAHLEFDSEAEAGTRITCSLPKTS